MFDELADAPVLMGDDTSPRVLEVSRTLQQAESTEPPPWAPQRNREQAHSTLAQESSNLAAQLASELDFEFMRRNGDGPKQSLHTTVVAGRSNATDPRSLIVFYRSHLGSFGNLVEVLLERRKPKAADLTVQSDLATVNLVANAQLHQRFTIRHVGCASHARRPFALYEDEDPQCCAMMLHLFQGLFIHERGLNLHGRNNENVLAVRNTDSRALWAEIKELAELMTLKWSAQTKLGEAARYIVSHFDALTAYLDDARLDPTNNFSERMLRLEQLIEDGSMFRATLIGRFVLDILRTMLQTAVAAGVPLQEYVLDILQTPPDEIAAAPQRFTPYAWASQHLDDDLSPSDADEGATVPVAAALDG
jgi:hypothetical protein